MTKGTRKAGLAAACALLLGLLTAGQAHAFIYYSQHQGPTILRANQDGTGVNENFVVQPGVTISRIAVDAGHIYWADVNTGSIGRSNLDGSGVNPNFITGAGKPLSSGTGSLVQGLAVDGGHIYWTLRSDTGTNGSIGRANIDGTGATRTFIPNITAIEVAFDAGHMYWTSFGNVGRSNLDGTFVDPTFVNTTAQGDAPAGLQGLTVNAGHVYWSNPFTKTIGRASIDGTGITPSFITVGGASTFLQQVAVDAGHIYWTDTSGFGHIGRASIDGTDVNTAFIGGTAQPGGLAVDSGGLRPTSTSVSCAPTVVIVSTGSSTCTATVTDTAAGAASSPQGVVTFDSNHPFDGAFFPAPTCTLTAGAVGTSSCALPFFPQDYFTAVPRTDVISATYAPSDTVHDGSGGNTSLSIVLADTVAPTTTIALSPGGPNGQNSWYVSGVHVTVSATDDDSGVSATRCVLDPAVAPTSYDAMPAGCAYTGAGADVAANGQHTVYAASIDGQGNKSTPVSRSFKIDTVAPNTTITSAPPVASTTTTPSFSFSSTESGSTFQCSIDGGVFSSCTSPKTSTLGGGAHVFQVRAIDPAGNVDASPAASSFRICTGLLGSVGVLLNSLLPNSGLLCS